MSLLDNLPHLATAKRRTRTNDSQAGSRDTFSNLFVDTSCWKQPLSDRSIIEYRKRGFVVSHQVYFATDPGVSEEDTLLIGGETFEVRSTPPDASAGLGRLFRVMVEISTTGGT